MPRLIALLIAVAWLAAGPALAQDQDVPMMDEPVGQASDEAPPQEVIEFLQDQRPVRELSDQELVQRAKQARQLSRLKGLTPEQRDALRSAGDELRAERQARMAPKPEMEAPEPQIGTAQPPPE